MKTDYPVLDNRPINKWKVAELREELKRRDLTTTGLKDELVRRLDEVIRKEREAVEDEQSKDSDCVTEPASGLKDAQPDFNHGELDEAIHKEREVFEVEESKGSECNIESASDLKDALLDSNHGNLDEAIHKEREAVEVEESKGSECNMEPASDPKDAQQDSNHGKLVDDVQNYQSEVHNINGDVAMADTSSCLVEKNDIKVLDEVTTGATDYAAGETKNLEPPGGITSVVNEIESSEIMSTDQAIEDVIDKEIEVMRSSHAKDVMVGVSGVFDASIQGSSTGQDIVDMKMSSSEGVLKENCKRPENDLEVIPLASKEDLENNSIKLETEGLNSSEMDAESDMSHPTTQVYEVNPNLGSQVKSESFSTDTLPIYENKDLNDNLNADNVKLEPEVVRQEMELQSSGKDLSYVGSSHPLDDQRPHERQGLVGEAFNDKSSDMKFCMKYDSANQVSVEITKIEHGLENKASNNSEQTDSYLENDKTLSGVVEPNLSPKKMEASAEEKLDIAASNDDRKDVSAHADISKITDAVDGENMEKINLDQSSADDSMEEDVVETKHVGSDHISKKENESTEEPVVGMIEDPQVQASGSAVAMQQDIPSEKVESPVETKEKITDLTAKRKYQDEVGAGSKEPVKRQRRWNTESSKTSEPQKSSIDLSKNVVQTTPVKPIIGSPNSTLGVDEPKERFVPNSSKTPTTSLRIDNFVRPFTLKAVQDLLARTGKVCSFWMDHIKTHCYVMYSSVEEAIETRNAVYNIQWPTYGGRLLVADFVDPEEVKSRLEGPPQSGTPAKSTSPAVPPAPPSVQTPPSRQQGRKPHVESEHPLARQPPPPYAPPTRDMLPSPVDKTDAPVVTLDDLFRKTKAIPRIYYLPLTDEEVAVKLASRGNTEH